MPRISFLLISAFRRLGLCGKFSSLGYIVDAVMCLPAPPLMTGALISQWVGMLPADGSAETVLGQRELPCPKDRLV